MERSLYVPTLSYDLLLDGVKRVFDVKVHSHCLTYSVGAATERRPQTYRSGSRTTFRTV